MWLSSQRHISNLTRGSVLNYNFYRIDLHMGIKSETAVAVRKGIPHNHVDLPLLIGVCIPIDTYW
jgi:hypothetical protein